MVLAGAGQYPKMEGSGAPIHAPIFWASASAWGSEEVHPEGSKIPPLVVTEGPSSVRMELGYPLLPAQKAHRVLLV